MNVACQAPLSVGFPRQEYWSRLLFPPPGDLPEPGIELLSLALAGGFFTTEPPGKPQENVAGAHVLSCFSRVQLFATYGCVAHRLLCP